MTEVEVRRTKAPPGFAQGIESVPFLMDFTITTPMLSAPKLTSVVALFLIVTCGSALFYVWNHYDDLREEQVRRQMEVLNTRE